MAAIDLVRFVCAAPPSPAAPLPGGLSAADATLLLARCAISPALPLRGRLRATALLADRPGAAVLLSRVLRAPDAADAVRAFAARLLADRAVPAALPELLSAAADPAFPLARCAAARALGACARHNVDAALVVLAAQLGNLDDVELVEAAADGLGTLGDPAAVPALAALLSGETLAQLHRAWLAHAPQLSQLPLAAWPLGALPQPARLLVETMLAAAATPADLPGGLDELAQLLAGRMARAAARALGRIDGAAAREALYVALLSGPRHDDAPTLIECLASIDPHAPLTLLGERGLDPMLRWSVARHCGATADGAALERALGDTAGDAFARGAFALALRGRGAHADTILRRLASSPDEEPYVREQAIAALTPENAMSAELLLLPLISSAATPVEVRCAAAAALPERLSQEARAVIAGLLRDRQLPDALHAALIAALGAAGDRAVMPVLLRSCQSSAPETARAALDALARIGDPSALSVLVGLAQSPNATRALRLYAAGTLLLLGGEEFLPLLRPALEHGTVALQFQALGHLQRALPTCRLLYELLQNRQVALSVRRLIAGALPADNQCAAALLALLADKQEAPELRALAASRLASDAWPPVLAEMVLAALVAGADAELPALRLRCIRGLGRADAAEAVRALGDVAEAGSDAHSRFWASQALLEWWETHAGRPSSGVDDCRTAGAGWRSTQASGEN